MGRFETRSSDSPRSDPAHEALCRRCGISCHLALPVGEQLVEIPALHCKFLAPQPDRKWQCTVYEERFEKAPWCHHADEALPLGFLARDCPYTLQAGLKRGKIRLREPLLSRYWPKLLAAVMREGVPKHVNQQAFLAEVARRQGQAYELIDRGTTDNRLQLRPCATGGETST